MPRANSRPAIVLVIAAVVLTALFAIGAAAPRGPDFDASFGIEAWRAPGVLALSGSFALLLVLFLVPGAADRVGSLFGRVTRLIPRHARLPILVLGCGGLFWFLPTVRLSGDASATMLRTATGEAYASNPLTCFIQSGIRELFSLFPAEAVRLVSVLSGMVFVVAAVGIGRKLYPDGAARAGLAGLLITCGTAVLFFGSIEVYAPLAAALTVYFLLGIRTLRDDRSVIAPAVVLGIAFGLHGSAGLLLPSLLLLANGGRFSPIRLKRVAVAALFFLVPVVAVYTWLFFASWSGTIPVAGPDRYGSFLGGMDLGPILPLTKTATNVLCRYAILDLEHFVGVLNLIILAAPAGVLLLLFSRGLPKRDPVVRFVAVAAVFLVLFPNFWNVNFSLRLDWDLFSLMGIPLTLIGGIALFQTRRGTATAVGAVALSLFGLVPLVITNLGTPYEQRRYALRCRSAMQGAPLVDREIMLRVQRAERHYEAEVRRLDPRDTEGRAARALILAESGHPRDAEVLFRAILAEEPMHAGAKEGLGFVLTELGRDEEARAPLIEALTADPFRLPCRLILVRIELRRNDIDAAIDQMEKGLRRGATHPAAPRGLFELARMREFAGDRAIAARLDRMAGARGYRPDTADGPGGDRGR